MTEPKSFDKIRVLYKGKTHLITGSEYAPDGALLYLLRLPGMLPSDGVIKAMWGDITLVNTDLSAEEPDIVY